MRTTLEIDDDLMAVARTLASERRETIGAIVSSLIRRALTPDGYPRERNGIRLITREPGERPPTLGLINELRDDE